MAYGTPPPPPAPKPKAPKNSFDEQNTNDAVGKPLPGTGSRYKNGKKIDLGVQHGP